MTEIDINSKNGEDEFLNKFGYRVYEGKLSGRLQRVWGLISFELKSTWHRSTFGKVLLIIAMTFNLIFVIITATIGDIVPTTPGRSPEEENQDTINSFVSSYLRTPFGGGLSASPDTNLTQLGPPMGFFLLIVFSIAGSGMFADDKNGKVVELYLSRITKTEYIMGKIGAIMIYINVFLLIPLLVTIALLVQSLDLSQVDYIPFYLRLVWFSLLYSLLFGAIILLLSSLMEKRNYASLAMFLGYIVGSIIALIAVEIEPDNEFYLLLSPATFFTLLTFVAIGDYKLWQSQDGGFGGDPVPFLLNDGKGVEYWHVYGLYSILLLFFGLALFYKIRKLTTEEL